LYGIYFLKKDGIYKLFNVAPYMKAILDNIIDEFYERTLPKVNKRDKEVTWLKGKANVIIGMRRAGKTWFCYQLINDLLQQGCKKEQVLYINFEDERLYKFKTENFQDILDVYYRKNPHLRNKTCYLFFDEIHLMPNWQSFIRRILDNESLHVCITGSSAKLLSSEIATNLRGGSLTTEIFPYSFPEIINSSDIDFSPNKVGATKLGAYQGRSYQGRGYQGRGYQGRGYQGRGYKTRPNW